jgi:hypothetical protein
MSRGPGRIQRAIEAAFKADPDNALTTMELCERVYGTEHVGKKHRVAVVRAAKRIPSLDYWIGDNLGGQLVFFVRFNIKSYGMARLKGDHFENYRNEDKRRCGWPWREPSTEAELRAKLRNAEHRKLMAKNGAWWRHIEIAKAKARGDEQRAAELQAAIDKELAQIIGNIKELA